MTASQNSPATTLTQEQDAIARLINALQKEQALLNQAQVDDLPALLGEKANAIAEMTNLASQRYAALEEAGFAGSEEGMQIWMGTHGLAEEKIILEELFASAVIAKELNRLNGLLIGKHMSNNQQILDAIQHAVQGGKIYGPDGQSKVKTPGRQLGIG